MFSYRPKATGIIPSPDRLAWWLGRQPLRNRRGVSKNVYDELRPVRWASHRTILKAAGLPETAAAWYELQKRCRKDAERLTACS